MTYNVGWSAMRLMTRFAATALLAGSIAPFVSAQGVIDDAYGRGVHAYFAGQNERALRWLDEAIDAGSQDPRVYYFHGLAMISQSGGTFEAGLSDIEKAALLEVDGGRVVNVYRALERIQGSTRRRIEDIRLDTFIANRDKLPRAPFEPTTPAPLDPLQDPFGNDAGLTTGNPADMPAVAPPRSLPPRGTPLQPAPALPPASDSVPPAANVPGGAEPNPFGTSADDPFGGEMPAGDSATNPFGDDAAANPFGE